LPSRIGGRRGGFLGLSVMFLPQLTMNKGIQWGKRTEQGAAPKQPGGPTELRSVVA
jgi:hypothetical protein